MRITTNMTMRNYQSNLGRALSNQNDARMRVMTKRNFNKMSEDPAGAIQAFRLRQSLSKTDDHLETLKTLQGELASVESSEKQILSMCDNAYELVQRAVGSPMSQEEKDLAAASMRELQKSMLLSVNASFGGKFLFGGADIKNVPFELDSTGTKLTYRGIDVSSTDPDDQAKLKALLGEKLYTDVGFGLESRITGTKDNLAGGKLNVSYGGVPIDIEMKNEVTLPGPPPTTQALTYKTMTDTANSMNLLIANDPAYATLKDKVLFSNNDGKLEITYPDTNTDVPRGNFEINSGDPTPAVLGTLGLTAADSITDTSPSFVGKKPEIPFVSTTSEIVDSTAYNSAIVGIELLGYGTDADGVSDNLIVLLGQLATKLEEPGSNGDLLEPYQKKLTKLRDKALNSLTQLGTNDNFLKDTTKRLEDNQFNLNARLIDIEDVDMAGGITEYMWAQYAYNAALKVGNSLLSTSFIDFMQ